MGRRWGGVGWFRRLFEAGRLFEVALILIRGWALIRINTVTKAGNMHINNICLTKKHPNRTM